LNDNVSGDVVWQVFTEFECLEVGQMVGCTRTQRGMW